MNELFDGVVKAVTSEVGKKVGIAVGSFTAGVATGVVVTKTKAVDKLKKGFNNMTSKLKKPEAEEIKPEDLPEVLKAKVKEVLK